MFSQVRNRPSDQVMLQFIQLQLNSAIVPVSSVSSVSLYFGDPSAAVTVAWLPELSSPPHSGSVWAEQLNSINIPGVSPSSRETAGCWALMPTQRCWGWLSGGKALGGTESAQTVGTDVRRGKEWRAPDLRTESSYLKCRRCLLRQALRWNQSSTER